MITKRQQFKKQKKITLKNKNKNKNKQLQVSFPTFNTITNKNLLSNSKSSSKSSNDNEFITAEVVDDNTYNHFKSLIKQSPDLCKGIMQTGKKYKIRKSILKDMNALKKDNHYRILYVHNNKEIIAYISTKIYKKDGGFLFIHKLCSKAGTGQGSRLFNIILEDGKKNHTKLGVTYLSLTTQNLDIVSYYNQFNPTRTIEVDTPESKALVPERCAYMIWQLSPDMPYLNYV
jgi:hypothetical protein